METGKELIENKNSEFCIRCEKLFKKIGLLHFRGFKFICLSCHRELVGELDEEKSLKDLGLWGENEILEKRKKLLRQKDVQREFRDWSFKEQRKRKKKKN